MSKATPDSATLRNAVKGIPITVDTVNEASLWPEWFLNKVDISVSESDFNVGIEVQVDDQKKINKDADTEGTSGKSYCNDSLKKGSTKKIKYQSRKVAVQAMRQQKRFGVPVHRAYHCPYCKGWHITKDRTSFDEYAADVRSKRKIERKVRKRERIKHKGMLY